MKDYIKQFVKIKQARIKDLTESFFCKDNVELSKTEKYAFVFLAADYNNLGDIAITTAQYNFLKKNLPDYKVICVTPSDTIRYCKSIKRLSPENVLVTLIGGGNNGSLYEFLERPRRFILNALKEYKIISFPQTVFFGTSEREIPYKNAFIKAANKCKKLTLFAREKYSLDKYKALKLDKVKVDLVPDIVFSLVPPRQNDFCGEGIALMLRNDIEKNVDIEYQRQMIDYLTKNSDDKIEVMDTWGDSTEHFDSKTLMHYLEKLSHKKIAITDRLHGMIFCFITQTPCIVIDSTNPKILSTYKTWLNNQDFIRIINTNASIQDFIAEYEQLRRIKINTKFPKLNYSPLIEACKGE